MTAEEIKFGKKVIVVRQRIKEHFESELKKAEGENDKFDIDYFKQMVKYEQGVLNGMRFMLGELIRHNTHDEEGE